MAHTQDRVPIPPELPERLATAMDGRGHTQVEVVEWIAGHVSSSSVSQSKVSKVLCRNQAGVARASLEALHAYCVAAETELPEGTPKRDQQSDAQSPPEPASSDRYLDGWMSAVHKAPLHTDLQTDAIRVLLGRLDRATGVLVEWEYRTAVLVLRNIGLEVPTED